MDLVNWITGAVGLGGGAAGTYVLLRRDQREARSAAMEESAKTIGLLEKQNELLEKQNDQLRTQLAAREEDMRTREAKWEKRIAAVEGDYRTLVATVTSMGYCAEAQHCHTYNPGDRRKR